MDVKHQLRELMADAVDNHGWTLYAIARESRIDAAALSRFVDDEKRDLSLTSAERLLEFFDVELSPGNIPKRN